MNPAIQGPEHRRQLIDGLRSGFIDYIATDHAPHTEEEKCSAFARMQEDFPHEKTNVALADRTAREKHYDFKRICCEDGMSGAPWLDTYAPVVTWLMMNENFITQEIARVTAYNPGKFVNPFLKHQFADSDIDFGKGFGKIEEGYVGSLTVINTQKGIEITRDMLKTKVGWSPLEGKEFPGSLESVIIRGKAYDSQGILQDA